MGLCNISLALVFLLVLAMVLSPHQAQNAPQDYLDAHNTARAQVGVGPMTWDNTVAAYAQRYANQRIGDCNPVHSGGPYGENLAMGSGALMGFGGFTGKDAVTVWVAEKPNYDYNSNSCAEGKECGHYTQVIWGNSIRLGCASAQCNNGGWFITCNYDPPGNNIGQRPYPRATQLHLVCTVEL